MEAEEFLTVGSGVTARMLTSALLYSDDLKMYGAERQYQMSNRTPRGSRFTSFLIHTHIVSFCFSFADAGGI